MHSPLLLTTDDLERRAIIERELAPTPQRIRHSILCVAQGICIRLTKAIIDTKRPLLSEEIQRHIEDESVSVRANAEKYRTCNDALALECMEDVRAMVAKVLPHYYPCPDERKEDLRATLDMLYPQANVQPEALMQAL